MPKEEFQNLALRRNLFYPAAEIYSSAPAGFWDFGPDGATIRRKVVDFWRKELVQKERFLEIYG
ncbi:MAG: Glycine-tRNA ligase, partial [Parcubacteria group bacterium GW2011_GWA2_48_9]